MSSRKPADRGRRARTIPPSVGAPSATRRMVLGIALGLVAANIIVYGSVRGHQFVYFDDQYYVTENAMVVAGLTWRGVMWAFTTDHSSNWHPLTWLSHMLDVQLYGMDAGGHHLTSLLLHVVNTLLLFGLLHRMTGAVGRSGFVAALFAVHPLHVESVAWVAERKDVLSTLFWLMTIWSYVSYVREPRRGRYAAVIVWFTLGLMAKPMLVTLPFVLLLLDYWPLRRVTLDGAEGRDFRVPRSAQLRSVALYLLREKTPLFALAATSSIVTFLVQQGGGSVVALNAASPALRAQNALVSYVAYVENMLWPTRLAALYPWTSSIPTWKVLEAALILIGALALVLRLARRHPYLPVGLLWYLGTLVPVIGLVQVGNQRMADRYTYVPLIGLFIIVAWSVPALLAGWRHRRIVMAASAAIVLGVCAMAARAQVRVWENTVALWQQAVDVTSDNFLAHRFLGDELRRQGKLDDAIRHYVEVVRLRPRYAEAHASLGDVLHRRGRVDEAIAQYFEALRIRSDLAEVHNNLGVALKQQGKDDEATSHFTEAARLNPEYADARRNLAMALGERGRFDEAIPEMLQALRIRPNHAAWRFDLAALYEGKGDSGLAVFHYQQSLRLDPRNQDARQALNRLNPRPTR